MKSYQKWLLVLLLGAFAIGALGAVIYLTRNRATIQVKSHPKILAAGESRLVVQLGQPSSIEYSAAFSADGKLLVVGDCISATAVIWDVSTGREIRRFARNTDYPGHQDCIMNVAFSPDAKMIAVYNVYEKWVRILDIVTGKMTYKIVVNNGEACCSFSEIAFSDDQRSVVIQSDEERQVWELSTGQMIQKMKVQIPDRTVFSWGRRFALIREGKDLLVVDVANKRTLKRLKVDGLAISPDGKLIAMPGIQEEGFQLLDVAKDEVIHNLDGYASTLDKTYFTERGLLSVYFQRSPSHVNNGVGGSLALEAHLRDEIKGEELTFNSYLDDYKESRDASYRVPASVSRDGRFVAVIVGKSVDVLNAKTIQRVAKLIGIDGIVQRVGVSSTGKYVITDSDHLTQVWEV